MQGCADGTSGDHIMIAPPAIIQEQEVGWAVERLGEAIEAARAQLKSSGIQGRVDLRDRAGC
jgi:adenosylmethionine-8-amino-7-oxononanoate aminotransferase